MLFCSDLCFLKILLICCFYSIFDDHKISWQCSLKLLDVNQSTLELAFTWQSIINLATTN